MICRGHSAPWVGDNMEGQNNIGNGKAFIFSEIKYFAVYCAILLVGFLLVFRKEGVIEIIWFVLKLTYLYILPGYLVGMVIQKSRYKEVQEEAKKEETPDGLTNPEVTLIGIAAVFAITSLASYFLGLAEVHVKYYGFILPPALIAISMLILLKKQKTNS